MRPSYPEAYELVERGEAGPQVVKAVALHKRGLLLREIAEELGLALSTVQDLLADPDRRKAKERKAQYDGRCTDCGRRTRGDGRRKGPPKRCRDCYAKRTHQQARERLLDALDKWVKLFGEPPTAWDWNTSTARAKAHPETLAKIQKRRKGHHWPALTSVQKAFGSWNAFITAGGYTPRRPGERAHPEIHSEHLRRSKKGTPMPAALSPEVQIERQIERDREVIEKLAKQIEERKARIRRGEKALKALRESTDD